MRSKPATQESQRMPPREKPSQPRRRKSASTPATATATSAPEAERAFPIVGIGASAGGLEALEQFLKHVPAGSGMAFVIVQHLDPTHKDIMVELLQRATAMKVFQVKDRMKVLPNCAYVIPPNKDMSILHGVLHLLDPVAPRGLRLPIDFFFRSLAADWQELSIGVILSGMGSDGSLGLGAIKEKGGVVFVQAPASAKFDGMPRSAIDAGLADVVAPVEELPGKIVGYLTHTLSFSRPELPTDGKAETGLEKVVILLRARAGHDFSLYKKNTVYRRIERRMGIHQIDKISTYVRFLQENPQELDLLFKELLIGVTSFFRDPPAWEQLKTEVLPALLAAGPAGRVLRAWTPGCATGEEAYSLAMLFKETLEQVKPAGRFSLQIFATDLDGDAIDKARLGAYPANIAADVSTERLRRFFVQEEHGYRVAKDIREMVIFAPQNVAMDPPFTKLDLLICRNLLIYFAPELQRKLLPLFHYSLNPGGVLFLGSAETTGAAAELFAPLSGKTRLFRRLGSGLRTEPIQFPASFTMAPSSDPERARPAKPVANLQTLADQLLLQDFSPAAALVNDKGDILYINGRTGKYLEPAAGKANWNIFAMAREGLRYELPSAFQKALQHKDDTITLKNLQVGTDAGMQTVEVTVRAMQESEGLRGTVMIVFKDVAALTKVKPLRQAASDRTGDPQLIQLKQEVQHLREELQTTREETQTSQEELKSANEELQSANEELQSTNEELTTSKEEMQSLNEELHTVNHELLAKVDELSRANNDMKNLLNSTEIATLFLDGVLHVRRFTTQTTKIFKLLPGDTGRPITDIASDLLYPELTDDALEVLRTLAFIEKALSTRDGRWFRARMMPYRTQDNKIDGVVITFTDITTAKTLEASLRAVQQGMEKRATEQTTELAKAHGMLRTQPDHHGRPSEETGTNPAP